MRDPNEKSRLLQKDGQTYAVPLSSGYDDGPGVTPRTMETQGRSSMVNYGGPAMKAHRSLHAMSNMVESDDMIQKSNSKNRLTKSYSVNADGSVSCLTPIEMGRHELYELVPFTAVFGLQRKERNLSMAFASYAADLDTMEADQIAVANTQKHLSNEEKELHRSHANLLMLDELEQDSVMVTTPLIFAIIVAVMNQFLVGYSTGVMNAPEAVVFPGHSTATWALAVSAFAIGGPFGANIAGGMAETRGRRGALLIDTWTFLVGGLIQTFANNIYVIIFSRFVIGFASGFSSVLVPIYLGELAPPTLRGTLGTLTQFSLVIGILISNMLAFPFATPDSWRILFSVTSVVAFVQLLCAPFLLESPRWLLNRDHKSRKARYIIKKLRGLRYDHEVETEVNHFISASKAQQTDVEISSKGEGAKRSTSGKGEGGSAFMEMFNDQSVRLLVVSALVLQMGQQLCGINAVFYYSTTFFEGVISNPLVGTTIVGAVNVIATYVALLLMDKCGRRTLILWSSGGMFICCIVLILSLLNYFSHIVALLAVNAYVSFFEIGLGPIPWLIVAEMFDAKYVATAMSACCQLNWACNFLVGLIFPIMNQYLKEYSFLPFAGVLLFVFIYAKIWLPETSGTTPEELRATLVSKNSMVVYHNMDIENAHHNPVDMEWRLAMEELRREEERAMKDGTYDYGFKPIS